MAKKTKIELPEEFKDEQEFLKFARELFKEDLEHDNKNRDAAVEDAKFMVGDQWDSQIKSLRDDDGKPTLTINHAVSFVGQLIGNRQLNDTVIKIVPDNGGTKEVARVREGLVRSIQKTSRAQRAYNRAFECQVIGGLGNFQVAVDFAEDDVFEQDIQILPIHDAASVVWDRRSIDPTGSDAKHVFVSDTIPRKEFERAYPEAPVTDFDDGEAFGGRLDSGVWSTKSDVRIASFWRVLTRKRTFALMTDGDVEDITDFLVEDEDGTVIPAPEVAERIVLKPDGAFYMREADSRYAEMYVISGHAVLEGPYRLPIKRVPVFKVTGWEVWAGEERHRWGLIRFMKDPMRFMNFWRSAIAEKIMRSPRAQFIGPDTAFEGYLDEWRTTHLNNDPVLQYNAEAGVAPREVAPVQIEPALIQAAQMAVQDLKDVTNLQDASLGIASNEVSGKAIVARQRVGELGTIIYLKNLDASIEEAGRVINDLIPIVYDTPRKIKVIGEDDAEAVVAVNTQDENGVDIASGKYSVSVITGPSTATKRLEAAESMLTFMNHAPQSAAIIGDLIAQELDWPGAQKIARRLKAGLPPGILGEEDMTEQEKAQQAKAVEAAAQQAAIQNKLLGLEIAEKEARVREAVARAEQAEAQAQKTLSEVGVAADQAEADIMLKEAETDLKEAQTVNEVIGKQERQNGRRDDQQ